jgi:hypothetical protein
LRSDVNSTASVSKANSKTDFNTNVKLEPKALNTKAKAAPNSKASTNVETKANSKANLRNSGLEEFYLKTWSSTFIPSYIQLIEADENPWSPTFNDVNTLQRLRDTLYPDTEQIIDKKSAVYRLVRVYYYSYLVNHNLFCS